MSSQRKALSIQTIRGSLKLARKDAPALDAGMATAALMCPTLALVLIISGAEVGFSLVVAVVAAIAMFVGIPISAGLLEGAGAKAADSVAFGALLSAVVAGTFAWTGVLPAGATLTAGSLIYLGFLRRNLARVAQKRSIPGLSEALVAQVGRLPKKLTPELREPVDEALAAFGSLVELLGEPGATPDAIDQRALLEDASACVAEVVARTEAAVKLDVIPTRTPEVEAAEEAIAGVIKTLVESLNDAVGAAAAYTAVGEAGAAAELAARAEYLHNLTQGFAEVDRALE